MTRTDLLILRRWRDGSVHAEVQTAAFPSADGKIWTHADNPKKSFKTLCGEGWFGKPSASGFSEPDRIDCLKCRSILMDDIKLDANLNEMHIGQDVLVLSQHIATIVSWGKNDEVFVRHFGGSIQSYISDELEVESC